MGNRKLQEKKRGVVKGGPNEHETIHQAQINER
jgi:hypothetical protein